MKFVVFWTNCVVFGLQVPNLWIFCSYPLLADRPSEVLPKSILRGLGDYFWDCWSDRFLLEVCVYCIDQLNVDLPWRTIFWCWTTCYLQRIGGTNFWYFLVFAIFGRYVREEPFQTEYLWTLLIFLGVPKSPFFAQGLCLLYWPTWCRSSVSANILDLDNLLFPTYWRHRFLVLFGFRHLWPICARGTFPNGVSMDFVDFFGSPKIPVFCSRFVFTILAHQNFSPSKWKLNTLLKFVILQVFEITNFWTFCVLHIFTD
jgi:hypothetical protein